ncbi:MAG: hypothetical protein JO316_11945 [Abitibacteriaceae bacterium]|nr:hypothetical protein [Abditibacteriaceae bacterium]MBV9866055.1 hypothetical protein [Abditibacteriaceae bacterium]
MAILIGLVLLAVGISLAVNQWAAFVVTLQALITVGLLFWGGVAVLVGYSEMKARREYEQAKSNGVNKSQKLNDALTDTADALPANNKASNAARQSESATDVS